MSLDYVGFSRVRVKKREICIIHCSKVQHGPFTAFLDIQDPRDRLSKLHAVKECRTSVENASLRMEEACKLIPQELQQFQGYHRAEVHQESYPLVKFSSIG